MKYLSNRGKFSLLVLLKLGLVARVGDSLKICKPLHLNPPISPLVLATPPKTHELALTTARRRPFRDLLGNFWLSFLRPNQIYSPERATNTDFYFPEDFIYCMAIRNVEGIAKKWDKKCFRNNLLTLRLKNAQCFTRCQTEHWISMCCLQKWEKCLGQRIAQEEKAHQVSKREILHPLSLFSDELSTVSATREVEPHSVSLKIQQEVWSLFLYYKSRLWQICKTWINPWFKTLSEEKHVWNQASSAAHTVTCIQTDFYVYKDPPPSCSVALTCNLCFISSLFKGRAFFSTIDPKWRSSLRFFRAEKLQSVRVYLKNRWSERVSLPLRGFLYRRKLQSRVLCL